MIPLPFIHRTKPEVVPLLSNPWEEPITVTPNTGGSKFPVGTAKGDRVISCLQCETCKESILAISFPLSITTYSSSVSTISTPPSSLATSWSPYFGLCCSVVNCTTNMRSQKWTHAHCELIKLYGNQDTTSYIRVSVLISIPSLGSLK